LLCSKGAVVADVIVASVGMLLGYVVRFHGAEVWMFLGPALPAAVLAIAVQVLVANRLGLYRPRRSHHALPLIAGAAAGLLVGAALAQFRLVTGLSRIALLCQAAFFISGGLSWRLVLAAEDIPPDQSAKAPLASMLPGAAIGALLGVLALDPGFVAGTGVFWDRPERDFNAYLVAWNYFVQDAWRFPVLDVPAMGYPEGGSVLFNDALPLAAIPSKIIRSVTGVTVNPFGYWVFTTYVLLGAFTSRLVRACGVRSAWAGAAAAFIVVTRGLFMFRLGHAALSGHFLIVWAFCRYVEDVSARRFSAVGHVALSAVTMLVNAYLVAMAAVIQAATVLTLLARSQLPLRSFAKVAVVVAGVIAVGLIEGYGQMFGSGAPSMQGGGFGLYSWNPITSLVPPDMFWNVGAVVRDATGGQYEGDSYLGAGGILVIAAVVLIFPLRVGDLLRRHWIVVAAVLLTLVFAGSHRLYLGSRLVYEWAAPARLLELAALFRASGRFVWIAAYSVPIVAVAMLVAWAPRALSATLLLGAVALQANEARLLVNSIRIATSFRPAPLLDDAQIVRWMSDHSRVFMFPSYLCGTLTTDMKWGSDQDNRELHLQLLAARLNRPLNSVYTSRLLKNCTMEVQWANKPVLEDGVLYLVSRPPALAVPALLQLYTAGRCVDGGYAVVCSTGTLRDDSSASDRDRLHLEPMIAESCGAPSSPMSVSWRGQDDRLQVRLGSPTGEVVGEGREGSRQLNIAPGTNVFLIRRDPTDPILDVETAYQRSGTCGAGDRNPRQ
jgi:hypothetical protein